MRSLSLCLAYYDNPRMLIRQLDALRILPDEVRKRLTLIVVDDASPDHPAHHIVTAARHLGETPLGFEVIVYRHRQNVPWNQDAARNLAVSQAQTEWLLLTDMDHVAAPILGALMAAPLDSATLYTLRRVTAPGMAPYKPHPNSYVMTKALYDLAGGYDERFAGVYGTDGMFAARATRCAKAVVELKEALIRYPREVIPDASTTTLVRKSPENDARRREIGAQVRGSPPVRGLFDWDRML